MKIILLFILLLFIIKLCGAQVNYDTHLIPKDLFAYASAVVRNEELTVEVKDMDNVTYHVRRVITVLNKNGDEKASLNIYYDQITSVKYIKGIIYDEYGKVLKKISERDFEDVAVTDGFSLFQDDRAKYYKKATTEYPYTIDFEYEVKTKQSFIFPKWAPNDEAGLSIEKSAYTFICKPGYDIRYKEFNLPSKVSTGNTKDGAKTYTWKVANLKAFKNEPFSPNLEDFTTRVMVAPGKFVYGKFNGSFTNWKEFGKWQYDNFLENREQIPDQTADYIKQLTAEITDPKLKAKKIYEYMQHKTHYVSVQIGIGGFQPLLASDVDKDGYGDCKALVNYTKALLKIAGIDSYYCLVYGNPERKLSLITDFASVQGNHAILCIPFKNDTTWMDCTSQTLPFGYLGDFTDDRIALACTSEGGKLMHTPKYSTEENLEQRKASFVIDQEGRLTGNMKTIFMGADYDDRNHLIEDAQTERVKDIRKYYPINNLEVQKLEYKQDKSLKPTTVEDIKLSAREYAAINDVNIYFSLNSINRARPLRQLQNRVNPVYISRGYTEQDEITYTLPKGYRLGSEPLKKSIEKPFGRFAVSMEVEGDQLVYKRKLQLKDGTYNKDTYQDMVDFYQAVTDADEYDVKLLRN